MADGYEEENTSLKSENKELKEALESVYKQNKFFVDRLGDIQREVSQIKSILKNAKKY